MLQFQNNQLTIFESALYRTTSTVIQTPDLIFLVDPTWLPHEIEIIQKHINEIQNKRPLYLLFTHSDYDHIIAWKAFPDAIVIVSKAFVDNSDKEKILQEIHDFDQTYYIRRNYLIAYPKGDIIIEKDGQELRVGETKIYFYLAPGHNVDGIFAVIQPMGIWITGDYLSNIEFPYIYHSSVAYENTLKKVEEILATHNIQFLIPGHGDYTTNILEIKKRKEESQTYIDQLRAAIKEGLPFLEDILWQRYQFEGGMKNFHKENFKLMRTELGSS